MNDTVSLTGNLIDLSEMTPDHIRNAMGWLGYELPGQISPADTAAAMALLQQLPPDALAVALNPGMRVEFSSPLPMPAVPGLLPVNGGLTATATGEVSLSGVQVGPGFEPQHTFAASVELTGGWSAGAGRTELNRITRGVEGYLPDLVEPFRDTIERWPRAHDFARGPDWMKGSYHYESFEGGRLSYEAVVPPSLAARIDAGDLSAVPNPLQPMAMPVGSSVIIRGEELEGSTHSLSYKLLREVATTTELEGVAFGVTRVSDSVFELTTGPIAAVEHDRYYGVGIGAANAGIGVSERYDGGSLDVVQVDLSTPEGQSAYQSFMQSGTVPDAVGPGVVDVSTRIQIGGEATSSLRANILGGSIGGAATTDFEKALTTHSDGTSEQRATLVGTSNRVGLEIVEQFDANEQPVPGSREWTVLLEGGMSADAAASLKAAYSGEGYDSNMPDGVFAELRFSDEELMRLRDTARESLRTEQPETYAYIESNRDEEGIGNRLNESRDMTQRLAAANTPEEVFEFGFMYASTSPELIAEGLRELSMPPTGQAGADTPLPGSLEMRDAMLNPLFPQPSSEAITLPPEADEAQVLSETTVTGETLPPMPANVAETPNTEEAVTTPAGPTGPVSPSAPGAPSAEPFRSRAGAGAAGSGSSSGAAGAPAGAPAGDQATLSPDQQRHLQLAREQLGPALSARGHSQEEIERICAAAVCAAQEHAERGPVKAFHLSKDGERVAVVQQSAPMSEMGVVAATQQPAQQHLAHAQQIAHEQEQAAQRRGGAAPAMSERTFA